MNKKKIILFSILGILFIFSTIFIVSYKNNFNFSTLTNDSGFDSDWGSSDSSWDDSDWGSSDSSWDDDDWDDDWDDDDFSSGNGEEVTFLEKIMIWFFILLPGILFTILAIIIVIIVIISKNKTTNNQYKSSIQYSDLSDHELAKYSIFDKEKLKQDVYNIYKEIQIAWMNNTIEDVRNLLSDEMFNMYKSQLLTLSLKNQQNVMSDFNYIDGKIFEITSSNDQIVIKVILTVTCKDYLVNANTHEIIRGNNLCLNHYTYELTFIKNNSTNIEYCPNCNAKLNNSGSSVKCEYCDSVVVRDSDNLVMTNKKMLNQHIIN